MLASAKSNIGIDEILEKIVEVVPPRLKQIFDSTYREFVMEGVVKLEIVSK